MQLLDVERTEGMARRLAWHDRAGIDQSALQFASAPRSNWRRSMISASRTATHGKSALPDCRTRRQARNVVLSDAQIHAFVAAAYRRISSLDCLSIRWP